MEAMDGRGQRVAGAPVAARIIVHGMVQGVFFRASTRDEARRLGLAGWVRNLPDGSVEVLAEGRPEDVERLAAWCRRGPPAARVDNVTVLPAEPAALAGFEVRR
jgi:acylphosphatase